MDETQHLIDRPLVIGMDAVLVREHAAVCGNEKVSWQAE
jgi:hypothetical protein